MIFTFVVVGATGLTFLFARYLKKKIFARNQNTTKIFHRYDIGKNGLESSYAITPKIELKCWILFILTVAENGGYINWGISNWIKSWGEIFQSSRGGEKFFSQERRGILDVNDLIRQPESVRLFFVPLILKERDSLYISKHKEAGSEVNKSWSLTV